MSSEQTTTDLSSFLDTVPTNLLVQLANLLGFSSLSYSFLPQGLCISCSFSLGSFLPYSNLTDFKGSFHSPLRGAMPPEACMVLLSSKGLP
jgi:hypothetical protein